MKTTKQTPLLVRAPLLGALATILAGGVFACGDNPGPANPVGQAAKGLDQLAKGASGPTGQTGATGAAPTGTGDAAAAGAAGAAAGEAAPTGETKAEEEEIAYAYSPIGKRDPFRSLFDQLRKEDSGTVQTELQTFEVDQLKLVAIVSRIATPYAMVEDPSGKGHTLTRGTLIGKNWGRVAEINPDCVVIKEEYRDYTGRKVTNKISVCLPKPEELKLD